MALYKKTTFFKIGVVVILVVTISSCNINNKTSPEFSVSLSEEIISMSQGGSASLFLEITAPQFVGKTINLKFVDLESGALLTNAYLSPSSFTLNEPTMLKKLELRLDNTFPIGRHDVQLVITVDNLEARLLLSLSVTSREPLELTASLYPSAIAIYQGEEETLVLTIETNSAETIFEQTSLELSPPIPDVNIDPDSPALVPGDTELKLVTSPSALPGLYETNMQISLAVNGQESEIQVPVSILILPNSTQWYTVSSPINKVGVCEDGFVAVGDYGALLTSSDGQSWDLHSSPIFRYSLTADDFVDFACGNGKLIIIGISGQIYVADLPLSDTSQWLLLTLSGEGDLRQIEFGDGAFVINAYSSFFISTDAQTWDRISIGWTSKSIKYVSGGVWLSAGYDFIDGTVKDVVYRSNDLWQSWIRNTVVSDNFVDLGGDIVVDDVYPYALVLGRNQYAYSSDLISWSARPYPDGLNTGLGCAAAYYSDDWSVWLACGDLYTTRNGRDWDSIQVGSPVTNIAYLNSLSTAIAAPRAGKVYASIGGSAWTFTQYRFASASPVGGSDAPDLYAFAYGDGLYVAVGREGTLSVSVDGDVWYARQMLDAEAPNKVSIAWNDVTYSPSLRRFVAVGSVGSCVDCTVSVDKGYIAWADSYSWNGRDLDWHVIELPDKALRAIAWGSGRYVAVGRSGVVIRSTDGSFWEDSYLPDSLYIYDVAANDENVFVASVNGATYVSLDGGATWARRELEGAADSAGYVCHDGNEFYMFQPGGFFWRSKDGLDWSEQEKVILDGGIEPESIESVYCKSGFKMLTIYGYNTPELIASTDGVSWKGLLPPMRSKALYNTYYANNSLFAVGQGAVVLRWK